MTRLLWIDPGDDSTPFPPPEQALREPDGLLAVGGSLSPRRLLAAYRVGIFPWYSEGQPVLWWSPDPRAVLYPGSLHVSRSLRRTVRGGRFSVTMDQDFAAVVDGCAAPRSDQSGTWITAPMRQAYLLLHRRGYAHSVEVRLDGELVGGLYGVALGGAFFGESMFSRCSNASKVALVYLDATLAASGFRVIDCQIPSEHLLRLGAVEISRAVFSRILESTCVEPQRGGRWTVPAAVSRALSVSGTVAALAAGVSACSSI